MARSQITPGIHQASYMFFICPLALFVFAFPCTISFLRKIFANYKRAANKTVTLTREPNIQSSFLAELDAEQTMKWLSMDPKSETLKLSS